MKNKNSKARMQVIFGTLLFALILMAELYTMINYSKLFVAIAVFAVVDLGCLYVVINGILIMKEQKEGGAIINVSSINATCPSDTLVHYGTSKAAVEFLTRDLAHDWGKYGIRVNCIAPGLIENPMLDTWVPGWRQSYCERAPLGRLVRPEDLGNAALFLGSPLASFITGQILTVDGGVLMAPAFFWD